MVMPDRNQPNKENQHPLPVGELVVVLGKANSNLEVIVTLRRNFQESEQQCKEEEEKVIRSKLGKYLRICRFCITSMVTFSCNVAKPVILHQLLLKLACEKSSKSS